MMILSLEELKKYFGDDTLTVRELKEKNKELREINSVSLARFLNNCENIVVFNNERNSKKYKLGEVVVLNGEVEKEKNILKLKTIDNNYIRFNFNTNDFVENLENVILRCTKKGSLATLFCDEELKNLAKTEWIYNYLDLLDRDINALKGLEKYNKIPSGYINFIQKNNLKINLMSFEKFRAIKELKHFSNMKKIDNLLFNLGICYDDTYELLEIINNLYELGFEKIIKNSIKNFDFDIKWELRDFLKELFIFKNNNLNYIKYLDFNRGIVENTAILEEIGEQLDNKILSENLQVFNFLNNLEIGGYIIKVPQSIEDLIDEGKQQNNCVGHYYNDSIIQKRNAIYFLRKKESVEKSCVTCRFNYKENETVERKIKNNRNTGNSQNNIIKQIDEIIREHLKNN